MQHAPFVTHPSPCLPNPFFRWFEWYRIIGCYIIVFWNSRLYIILFRNSRHNIVLFWNSRSLFYFETHSNSFILKLTAILLFWNSRPMFYFETHSNSLILKLTAIVLFWNSRPMFYFETHSNSFISKLTAIVLFWNSRPLFYFETHSNCLILKLTAIVLFWNSRPLFYFETHSNCFISKLTAIVLFWNSRLSFYVCRSKSGFKTAERASVAKKTTTAAMTENYFRRKRLRTATRDRAMLLFTEALLNRHQQSVANAMQFFISSRAAKPSPQHCFQQQQQQQQLEQLAPAAADNNSIPSCPSWSATDLSCDTITAAFDLSFQLSLIRIRSPSSNRKLRMPSLRPPPLGGSTRWRHLEEWRSSRAWRPCTRPPTSSPCCRQASPTREYRRSHRWSTFDESVRGQGHGR